MNTLQLLIDAGWPHQHTDASWRQLDANGRIVAAGRSEPKHWPNAETSNQNQTVELLLSADHAVFFRPELPDGKAGRQREVIAYALEDKLLDELDNYHFAVGSPVNGFTPVIAISRVRLRDLIAHLNHLGRVPRHAFVAAQTLAHEPGTWVVSLDETEDVLVTDGGWVTVTSVAGDIPPELELALCSSDGARCERISICGPGSSLIDVNSWQQQLSRPVVTELISEVKADARIDLLQGEFASARAPHPLLRHWRKALVTAGIALVIYAGFNVFEWGWLAHEARNLRADQASLFRETFPQTTVVMPALQLRRSLDEERHRRGLAGEADFLALTAVLTDVGGTTIEELRYGSDRLDAVVRLPDRAHLSPLLEAIAMRGIMVSTSNAAITPSGFLVTLGLRKGPQP